jgi:DNA-binding transcriptional ArsR family regulator
MSPQRHSPAAVFAALGDPTRLALVGKLSAGTPLSIARLTDGSDLTRQAVTKHLRVLESSGVIGKRPQGRESLYQLQPAAIQDMRAYLDGISRQWDDALARLKAFVEAEAVPPSG